MSLIIHAYECRSCGYYMEVKASPVPPVCLNRDTRCPPDSLRRVWTPCNLASKAVPTRRGRR